MTIEQRYSVNPANYFARIGLQMQASPAPTREALDKLIAHHIAAIPFENIDVLLGLEIDISPAAVDRKLIADRRGGYCFEQNDLFKRMLISIGYQVESLAARVLWRAAENTAPRARTHSVLKVTLDGEALLVDVGFGGWVPPASLSLTRLYPLIQTARQEVFRMMPHGTDIVLETRLGDTWRALYALALAPMLDVDFQPLNWYTSTHPDSIFRHNLMLARTTHDTRYTLLNGRMTSRRNDGVEQRRDLDAGQIETVLSDIFCLAVQAEWRPMLQRAAATI